MTQNVCFLISDLEKSGGTQRILTLLCNLLADHYNVYIIITHEGEPFFTLDNRVNIISLPSMRFSHLQRSWDIYNILKKFNIDVYVNLDSNSILFYSLLLPKNTKLVLWEHFSLANNSNKPHFIASRHYATLRCSSLVLISKYEISEWSKYNPLAERKSKLIYNPLSIDESKIDTSNKYQMKSFLAIGNNIDVKGFDILVKIWHRIKEPSLLRIIGLEEDQIVFLQNIIDQTNIKNIELYGRVKNISNYYSTSSVLLLPSRKEATPLVLIESQAYGIPAIVFNHLPGVLELINKSATIVDYDESGESFLDAINTINENEDLYTTLHLNAIENAQRFKIKEFRDQWIRVLS
ncbi:glycosyltransferase [Psychrobacter sp. Marseille-P5312]|uniref:glycosyltransferase n=1 Tax=Psychrobacter sp. Marseille-P5312 TaxID=2086574 RepID=UPI000CF72C44|nr:glycosyltransferase [Psychrobacter sp. Marseille-P5312]